MNKDSKKKHEIKRQITNKLQSLDIDKVEKIAEIVKAPDDWEKVKKIALFSSEKNIETEKFILCFDFLNWNECNFVQFDQAKSKKLVKILEKVTKCKLNKFPELRLIRDSVGRVSPYESLFTNLSKDVTELKEADLCDGRIFFYITEPMFNIVSIEAKHRNIDR